LLEILWGVVAMRASLPILVGALALLAAAAAARAQAFDSTQFCLAVRETTRYAEGDVGTWTDRVTRNDGVEVACDRKLVHFKRYYSAPASALRDAWKERKAQEWENAYCKRPIWREAVDNGWIVSSTVTTVTGERLWLACLPGGKGFHRGLP
jgi:hypothetical protein